jgi:hypothetical protein
MHLTNRTPDERLLRIRARARSERSVPAKVEAYLRGETSPWATTEPSPDDCNEEKRRFNRAAVASEIVVRRIGGFNFHVTVKDISSGGCRIEMLEPCEIGDQVIARLPELEPLGSRVRWGQGATTGIQFLTTIHPAVLDALLSRLPNAKPVPE